MLCCILNRENTIENIIVIDDGVPPSEFSAVPYYEGAGIGDLYSPPPNPPTSEERLAKLESENALLKAQLQAQTQRSDFIEDCIAEMAMQVYVE